MSTRLHLPCAPAPSMPETLAGQAQGRKLARRKRRSSSTRAAVPKTIERKRSPTQHQGACAEAQALACLQAQGFMPLTCNARARTGEIDIIGLDGRILAFVEVRQRNSDSHGGAAASVGARKRARLIRTAQLLLPRLTRRFPTCAGLPCRFDVVAIGPCGLRWLKQAFTLD